MKRISHYLQTELSRIDPGLFLTTFPDLTISDIIKIGKEAGLAMQMLGSSIVNVAVYNSVQCFGEQSQDQLRGLSPAHQNLLFDIASLMIRGLNMLEKAQLDLSEYLKEIDCEPNHVKQSLIINFEKEYLKVKNEGHHEGLSKMAGLFNLANQLGVQPYHPMILFEKPNYDGASIAIPAGRVPDLKGGHYPSHWGLTDWHKNSASVKISTGFAATLCSQANFQGVQCDLIRSCSDISKDFPMLHREIESMAVTRYRNNMLSKPMKN
jgi:hypothetical protein